MPMKFNKRYSHLGYSHMSVPDGWVPIVKDAIRKIEKEMWPRWFPWPLCSLIHWLATGNSIVRIKYRWAFDIRRRLTRGQMIRDIKEKYASLRIYGSFNDKIEKIIEQAEIACSRTCQKCGASGDDVKPIGAGWIYNLCAICAHKLRRG